MAKQYLTVGQFRDKTKGLADDVVIGISCENRWEPHPVIGGFFEPSTKRVSDRVGVEGDIVTFVELYQDEGADFSYLDLDDEDDD